MFRYSCGREVLTGDRVSYRGGVTAVVLEVAETPDRIAVCGLDEAAIMLVRSDLGLFGDGDTSDMTFERRRSPEEAEFFVAVKEVLSGRSCFDSLSPFEETVLDSHRDYIGWCVVFGVAQDELERDLLGRTATTPAEAMSLARKLLQLKTDRS